MTINEFNFAGKKAIVRVDFNVPLDENGKITWLTVVLQSSCRTWASPKER